jgi:hypothetical protein
MLSVSTRVLPLLSATPLHIYQSLEPVSPASAIMAECFLLIGSAGKRVLPSFL